MDIIAVGKAEYFAVYCVRNIAGSHTKWADDRSGGHQRSRISVLQVEKGLVRLVRSFLSLFGSTAGCSVQWWPRHSCQLAAWWCIGTAADVKDRNCLREPQHVPECESAVVRASADALDECALLYVSIPVGGCPWMQIRRAQDISRGSLVHGPL